MTGRALNMIVGNYSDISIESIEVTTSPLKAWTEGVRMIPALRIGENTLSGLFLSSEQIRSFIDKNIA